MLDEFLFGVRSMSIREWKWAWVMRLVPGLELVLELGQSK
jgi:hypothetical protein